MFGSCVDFLSIVSCDGETCVHTCVYFCVAANISPYMHNQDAVSLLISRVQTAPAQHVNADAVHTCRRILIRLFLSVEVALLEATNGGLTDWNLTVIKYGFSSRGEIIVEDKEQLDVHETYIIITF